MAIVDALHVNGERRAVAAAAERSLLSVLRDDLDLTGAKYGCGEAQCGACIVLVDGAPLPACVTPVAAAAGRQVLTIEGLARNGTLHPLQQAFVDAGAMQCGYCTPGMIMMALALLRQTPRPTEAEIVRFMQGNVCRCGVYPRIVRAIQEAAAALYHSVRSGPAGSLGTASASDGAP
jgi:aerobic-type carbon monoxide dehydrogenase small subunit (CoxS/CutS family)